MSRLSVLKLARPPFVGFLGVTLVLLSIGPGQGGGDAANPYAAIVKEEPGASPYRRLGNHSLNRDGLVVTAHTYLAKPGHFAFVYSIACIECDALPNVAIELSDALGNTYTTLRDIEFGDEGNVKFGLLITEPFIEGGKILSLSVLRDGAAVGRLDILENTGARPQSSFTAGGRLAPEEGVIVGKKTMYPSGAPGTQAVEMAVREAGNDRKYYALIESDGSARAVSEAEYREGFPQLPEGLPTPPPTPDEPVAAR